MGLEVEDIYMNGLKLAVQNSQLLAINKLLNDRIDEQNLIIEQLQKDLAEWNNLKNLSKSTEDKKMQ